MQLPRKLWLSAGLVLVLAVIGVWAYRSFRPESAEYRTATVETGPLVASVSATGTVRPVVQVAVGSQVSGIIQKLHVDYNDRVRSGQVLAEIEPSFFRAAVVQAEANVSRAEAAQNESERALRRARELTERQVMAEVELEAAETAQEQRKAEVMQAKASLETARVNLSHTLIRSPIDGVVLSRSVDVGQTVAASLQAPQLYLIAGDLEAMQIETKIDEADIGQVRTALPVSFTVDAFPDRRFQGQVSQVRLEPIAEDNVVTYTTVIEVQNPDRLLRPGMTANVTIVVAERANVLKVPNAALRFRPPDAAGRAGGAAWARVDGAGSGGGRPAGAGAGGERGSGTGMGDGSGGGREGRAAGAARMAKGGPDADSASQGAPGAGAGARRGAGLKVVYRLDSGGNLVPIQVRTGVTDGTFTEVLDGELSPGDRIVVGTESESNARGMSPPPGFGGGPGGGRGR